MKLPFISIIALCAASAAASGPADAVPPKVADALAFAPDGGVKFQGWIGEAVETCRRGRILGQSIPDLVQPFAVREEEKLWRCEFWGKWFTSAVLAYRVRPDPALRAILDEAVKGLLATQTPDGAITTYKPANELGTWDVWGRKYTLLGLLDYHALTGETAVLKAACRHADRIMEQVGPDKRDIVTIGMWTGMASSSIIEPMVLLYRRTGEKRYLDFARYIVRAWEGPKGPDLFRKALDGISVFKMFAGPDPAQKGYMSGGASKAYEMMSCYEGLVELHRATGDAKFREAARKVLADIRETEITILGSGSSWERWCDGRRRQAQPVPEWMETCVTATWMKFAAQLLRLTGEPPYADDIESATYNALLAAQKDDGTWWCHYNPLEGARTAAPEQCAMHMNCCVANGPRALMLLPALAVMSGADGPAVNFFEPAEAKLPLPKGGSVRIAISGDYPRPGPVDIAVFPDAPKAFTLRIRVPAWSRKATIEVNGETVPGVKPGTYTSLDRAWQSGDKVRLTLDFSVRREPEPGGSGRVAITRGPVVFALDRRFSKPVSGAVAGRLVADADGVVAHAVAPKDGAPRGAHATLDIPFEAGGAQITLRLCDYASAGHTWAEDSTLRVWLPQPLNLANPFEGIPEPEKSH